MERVTALDVFYGDELIGTVFDTEPLSFEYAQAWLGRQQPAAPFPLSSIALQPGRLVEPHVQAFFENLLPEGEVRAYLSAQRKASTLFALLQEVAGDTAGAYVMLPQGQRPQPPQYEPTSWQALADILKSQSAAAIQVQGEDARISLAGAQDKATIAIFDGQPMLPKGHAPSTHILKPDIRRLAKVRDSAVNEAIIMRTAKHCGLRTAEVFYEPLTKACVVERFDRLRRDDGGLSRVIQYDLCQLAGTVSERKYEKEGGPGLQACARLIREHSSRAALDLQALVQWVFFNICVGNNDSHAKNLSLYALPGQGVRLTPFYDLMCTRIYPGLSKAFAFNVGGEVLPGQIGHAQLQGMAQQLGMKPRYVQTVAEDVAVKVPAAIDQAVNEISPLLAHSSQTFAEHLTHEVKSITKKAQARFRPAS
jgi:serine/threonine-protein kinase HipA